MMAERDFMDTKKAVQKSPADGLKSSHFHTNWQTMSQN